MGTLKVVKGRLNTAAYVQLICHTLKEDGRKLCGNNFIFQRDGAPCHSASSTKAWFQKILKFSHEPGPESNRTRLGRNED